jgi:hypothetical protein
VPRVGVLPGQVLCALVEDVFVVEGEEEGSHTLRSATNGDFPTRWICGFCKRLDFADRYGKQSREARDGEGCAGAGV